MLDIQNRDDIVNLINKFYETVQNDNQIGHFFNDVAKVDWSHHLPQMYNFWESLLLGKKTYTGNPMRKHIELAKLAPLKHEHFERWIEIFSQTVDDLFKGDNANRIIEYAKTIRENLELRTSEVA
ncbi:MAG: group III truncated hemoglobin [Neisseriaceae bacterium]|nr:MAG: group III truncated hemoglobin [Neisseriaceae bacterium]